MLVMSSIFALNRILLSLQLYKRLDSGTGGRRGDVRQLLLQLLTIFPPKWAGLVCYTELSDSMRRISIRIRKNREQLWPCTVFTPLRFSLHFSPSFSP